MSLHDVEKIYDIIIQFFAKLYHHFSTIQESFTILMMLVYHEKISVFNIVHIRAPSQYKDRLIYVWRFPC